MVYLDNAATSFPKPDIVYEKVYEFMKYNCANPGRGGYKMAIESGHEVMTARRIIAEFFNFVKPLCVCFTKNATEALNIGLKGVLRTGDHVITTSMEHNSVIRPLFELRKNTGIEITIVKGDAYGNISADDIAKNIRRNTRLIVCTVSSNVNGTIMPFTEIGNLIDHERTYFLLDASQGAGTLRIDVQKGKIDMLAFPGHKYLLGPQGTGGLYIREGVSVRPLLYGGTGSNSKMVFQPGFMPDSFESGTLNTPGIVGLRYGIEFIINKGIENITSYKQLLLKRLYDGLIGIKGLKLYSKAENNSGIIAFNIDGIDPVQVSETLDRKFDIASRAGYHCAPLAHKTLGTHRDGSVRLSLGCFNTLDEIDYTVECIEKTALYSRI